MPTVLMEPVADAKPAPAPPPHAFEALVEIGREIQAEEPDLDTVLKLVVIKAAELLHVDVSWLGLLDEPTGMVRIRASCGSRERDFEDMAVRLGAGVGGVALRRRCNLVVPDYPSYGADTPNFVHDVMAREGIVSLMCSPMVRGDSMVGVLYAGNRHPTSFGRTHSSLLSTLATQASVAIQNGRLYRELEHRNRLLEQSFAVHNELTAVAVREMGLAEIGKALARIVHSPLVVEQQIAHPFRVRYEPRRAPIADAESLAHPGATVPILAGDRELGRISVAADDLSELETRALEHGATVMALELLKQRTAWEVEWRLQGELLEELLEASEPLSEAVALRAERLHVDPAVPRRLIAFEPDDDRIEYGDLLATVRAKAGRSLGLEGGPVLAVKRGGRVVLALPEPCAGDEQTLLLTVQGAVRQMGSSVSSGISAPQCDLNLAYREAVACLKLARRTGRREAVLRAAALGPLRFLLDGGDVEHATRTVHEQLGSVFDHDRVSRTPLLATLRAYLDADGHQPTVAKKCFIHVSTLKYRMRRLRELMGVDLSDPEVRFELRLAFRLLDLLEAIGAHPPDRHSSAAIAAGSSR